MGVGALMSVILKETDKDFLLCSMARPKYLFLHRSTGVFKISQAMDPLPERQTEQGQPIYCTEDFQVLPFLHLLVAGKIIGQYVAIIHIDNWFAIMDRCR